MTKLGMWRIGRLCAKELRESLRDRRTIVTLVLMPLLVYPLLSLILNRVLLTGVVLRQETVVAFGLSQELSESQLPGVLTYGYGLLEDPLTAPMYLEQTTSVGGASGGKDAKSQSLLPQPRLTVLSDDGSGALANGSIDLIISKKTENEQSRVTEQLVSRALQQLAARGSLPPSFDPSSFATLIGNYRITYRNGDQQSERAVQLLERILAAVNNDTRRQMGGGDLFAAPFSLTATPVVVRSNYADLLATMVPLVLVLMTMAGAVYPAIDLTAGERERGTMEALIVSPTPVWVLLLAKYSAVVTVALLTALANLTAMSVTLWASGIGTLVFGDGSITPGVIGTVLVLLVLFTMFFAALLLAVTSFAKSFKEAQAYLIPLMLLALAPGVLSLLPGIRFSGILATVPLVNIVLLARQVLVGDVDWNAALVAVICNGVYALAALAIASKLFGSDASINGSQGSWRDLVSRPREQKRMPGVDQMAMTMAVMFPVYFVISSLLPGLSDDTATKLWISAGVSYVLIMALPIFVCWFQRTSLVSTFRLKPVPLTRVILVVPAVLCLGLSAWMAAHEIFMAGQALGIGTIDVEQMDDVSEFRQRLQAIPIGVVLFVFAITPAVCEEFLFRGFVLSSLSRLSGVWAVILSSILFGLMHVLTSNVLAVERFLPSTFMGLILGYIALRTRSLWPGIVVHALHNGFLLSVSHYQDVIKRWGILVEEGEHLPATWLATGAAMLVTGLVLVWWSGRAKAAPPAPVSATAATSG
ncbi:MAG: ABC transporter permease subunit [Aureliella sp.]